GAERVAVGDAAGREIGDGAGGDHDVERPRETKQHVPARGGVEVDRRCPLADVVVPEVEAAVGGRLVAEERADPARRRADGRLELDDVRAEARQQPPRVLPALVHDLEHAEVGEAARQNRASHTWRLTHVSTPASMSWAISASGMSRRPRRTACVSSPRDGGPRRVAPPGWTSPSD